MGATSVSGVGLGMANGQKGPHNGREYFVPIVSPHCVTAGSATTAAGTVTVTFPVSLAGDKSLYAVSVCPTASTSAAYYVVKTNDGSGNFTSFTLHGDTAIAYDYVVSLCGVPFNAW